MRRTLTRQSTFDFQSKAVNHPIHLQLDTDERVSMPIENISKINNLNELLDSFQKFAGLKQDLKTTHILIV
jgi:hypothetical protein